MKSKIVVILSLLFCYSALVSAQVVPSLYTPLSICSIYSLSTPANTTVFIPVRDICNIPQTANAVALIVSTSNASGNGVLYVWDAGILQPSIPSMFVRNAPGGDSLAPIVRLCYPREECAEIDIHLRSTVNALVTLSAIGYFEPF
jgi:hypothetical protein